MNNPRIYINLILVRGNVFIIEVIELWVLSLKFSPSKNNYQFYDLSRVV